MIYWRERFYDLLDERWSRHWQCRHCGFLQQRASGVRALRLELQRAASVMDLGPLRLQRCHSLMQVSRRHVQSPAGPQWTCAQAVPFDDANIMHEPLDDLLLTSSRAAWSLCGS